MLARLIELPTRRSLPVPPAETGDVLSAILGLLNRVSAIADAALPAPVAIERIFEEVCDYSGWPIGHLYVRSAEDESAYVSHDVWYLEDGMDADAIGEFQELSDKTVFSLGKGVIGQIAEARRARAIEDVTVLDQFLRADAARRNEVRGFFGFPVVLQDRCVAVAEFYGRQVGSLDDTSLEIMTYVSSQLARVFERDAVAGARQSLMRRFETSVQGAVKELDVTSQDLTSAAVGLDRQCRLSLDACADVVEGTSRIVAGGEAMDEAMSMLAHVERETEQRATQVLRVVDTLGNDIRRALADLSSLSTAARDIGDVVRNVGEIAGQVRMLGLNASIEAARAGAAGQGFGIVASEIKSLAVQSEAASVNIAKRISSIQNVVEACAGTMTAVGERMHEVEDTAAAMEAVLGNQREASTTISRHVGTSKETVSRITQEVSSMDRAMNDLSTLARNLRNLADGLETTSASVSSSSGEFLAEMAV